MTQLRDIDVELSTKLSLWERLWKMMFSPLPTMSFVLALFYAQGRAWWEGYLNYFGLYESQFPVSTTDAYWSALLGWTHASGVGLPFILRFMPLYALCVMLVPLFIFLGIKFLLKWFQHDRPTRRRTFCIRKAGRRVLSRIKRIPRSFLSKAIDYLASSFIGPLLVITPLAVATLLISILVLPFVSMGQAEAEAECSTAAQNWQTVRYERMSSLDGTTTSALAKLLTCGSEFCALVENGTIIPIQRTKISFGFAGELLPHRMKLEHVPLPLQLCFKSPSSAYLR